MLEELWGAPAKALLEGVLAAHARGHDGVPLLRDALLRRLRECPYEPAGVLAVRAAVRRLQAEPASVSQVATELGVSARHLRRGFLAAVGVGPKAFARLVRFQRALTLGRAHPGTWHTVARATGYFDQAHLIADFRELALHSPTAMGAVERRQSC